jgi:hypothetical protein
VSQDQRVDLDERRFRDGDHRGAPPSVGVRRITAILPNGRTVRLAAAVPLAPASSVGDLAGLARRRSRQHDVSGARQRWAIRQLSHTVVAGAERVSLANVRRTAAIGRRLADRSRRLDMRLTKASAEMRERVQRQIAFEVESVRRLHRRNLWDNIVVASSFPLFAAFGEQGRPFSTTNLALTLSLLVWLVGDDVVRRIFGSEEKEKSPYPWRETDIWSYLAPIGNVLTAWWLFGDRQNARFITGVTTMKIAAAGSGLQTFAVAEKVDLVSRVALDDRDDFKAVKDVPVVATVGATRLEVAGAARSVSAWVHGGALYLDVMVVTDAPVTGPGALGEIDIAWIVDTAQRSAATS